MTDDILPKSSIEIVIAMLENQLKTLKIIEYSDDKDEIIRQIKLSIEKSIEKLKE